MPANFTGAAMPGFGKGSPSIGDVHVPTAGQGKPPRVRSKPRDVTGAEIVKAEPKPLYVSRKVVNADEIIAWAKSVGFETTLEADALHVTVTYSRAPVDWLAMGDNWSSDQNGNLTIPPGGPRLMQRFGPEGQAVVLTFASSGLSFRHEQMIEMGCSWDHPGYEPHITISYGATDLDVDDVKAFQGAIVLGPEIFAEIDDDWSDTVVEKGFNTFFKVSGVDEGLGLVFGWGIVCTENGAPYVDSHKNYIPEAAMVEATTDFMKGQRVAGDGHVRMGAGTIVHSFPLTAEIAKAMGIECDRTGWMVGAAPDPTMLAKFASGEYTGFSIGGEYLEIDSKPLEAK